jgi:hypothetical protein
MASKDKNAPYPRFLTDDHRKRTETGYGQLIFAMPVTFRVIWLICATVMLGSAGAVASIVTIPLNPLHWAKPLLSMLGPVAEATDVDMLDIGVGVAAMKAGFPILHRTGGDITVIGAMLNVPVAAN